MDKRFDVFLSHNSKDKPAVRELVEALQDRGLTVWLDEWELVPGRLWQEALEEVIETTGAAAVLVGKDGIGPWQDQEMRGCLNEFVQRKLPVIPVLLPGAPEKPRLPMFLSGFTWVDMRAGLAADGLGRLQWGITGRRPNRAPRPSPPAVAPEAPQPAPPGVMKPAPSKSEVRAAVKPSPSPGVKPTPPKSEGRAARRLAPPIPLLVASGTLAVVIALGVLLAQWSGRAPSTAEEASLQEDSAQLLVTETTGAPSESPQGDLQDDSEPALPPTVEATCVPGEEHTINGIVYVRICQGTFTMGSADDDLWAERDEKPARQVMLSEFWIDKTEITNEQYRRFRPGHQGKAGLPVTNVTWSDAQAACERFGGRLPTEAQWEYAARAGSRTAWSFGDIENSLGEHAWFEGNSNNAAHPVGTKKPNAWGLHDMHGNVWEWVADWYESYPNAAQTDPIGPSKGTARVLRGGAFNYPPRVLRSAFRVGRQPEDSNGYMGFRCVRSPSRQP